MLLLHLPGGAAPFAVHQRTFPPAQDFSSEQAHSTMDGEWTLKKRLQPAPLRKACRARRPSKPRAPLITDEPGEWAVAEDPRPCALTCTPPSAAPAADPSAAQPPAAALVKPKAVRPALPEPPAKTHAELLAQYVPVKVTRMALDEDDWLMPEAAPEPTAPDSSVA